MKADAIAGLVLLGLAVAFWIGADAIRQSSLSGGVGADGLPKLLAVALGVLSAILVIQSVAAGRKRTAATPQGDAASESDEGVPRHLRAAGVLGIGVFYLLILPFAGYLVSVGLLLLVVALYYGRPLTVGTIAFAVIGALAFYVIFVALLDVRMPAGLWPSLLAGA